VFHLYKEGGWGELAKEKTHVSSLHRKSSGETDTSSLINRTAYSEGKRKKNQKGGGIRLTRIPVTLKKGGEGRIFKRMKGGASER